ncbi:unnamed protein product, partial [Phaeothamnion confervicola]
FAAAGPSQCPGLCHHHLPHPLQGPEPDLPAGLPADRGRSVRLHDAMRPRHHAAQDAVGAEQAPPAAGAAATPRQPAPALGQRRRWEWCFQRWHGEGSHGAAAGVYQRNGVKGGSNGGLRCRPATPRVDGYGY